MSQRQAVKGNIRSLAPSLVRRMQRLYARRIDPRELVSPELAREVLELAQESGRRIGVLISREGTIEEVFVGTREILYLPDLGRYRLGASRLRRLRLVFSDLSKGELPHLPADIMADLEKLRLDLVAGVKLTPGGIAVEYAHLAAPAVKSSNAHVPPTARHLAVSLSRLDIDVITLLDQIEEDIAQAETRAIAPPGKMPAALVAVSDRPEGEVRSSLNELEELARTAGIYVVERIIQRKKPDPRSVLGKGKLEEVVLRCLRLGVELIVFDTELRPSQWRTVTNATELKVIDRSMLILDIFAQRAQSSEGRLQVELAQLKYNLPRLVEKDAGLSRLTGGIGGRGPGETKLEVSRRRTRERINDLEREIENFRKHRAVKRKPREERGVPLVALVGYTNVGKSTLFNRLTGAGVIAENKLFATLDPFQRRIFLKEPEPPNIEQQVPSHGASTDGEVVAEDSHDGSPSGAFPSYTGAANYINARGREVVVSDTVGFIRDLPVELVNAFRATLEELYSAALLVHVLDASDPELGSKVTAVRSILASMELGDTKEVCVLNKIDLVSSDKVEGLCREFDAIAVSALSGEGISRLLASLAVEIRSAEESSSSPSSTPLKALQGSA